MNAKEFLESKHIEDRVLNREDLPEFLVTISQLLNDFKALSQPSVRRFACKHEWRTLKDENLVEYESCKKCWKVKQQNDA